MKIKFIRSVEEMSPVLLNPEKANTNQDIYWVFERISKRWEHSTLISPGLLGDEFIKTFGHYHTTDGFEKYKILSGQGIFVMQKRKFGDEDWINDQIEKVYFVEFQPGDEVIIPPEWGHSCSNIGSEPLLMIDDWKGKEDYTPIKDLGGMSYFLINKNKGAEFVKNKKYKDVPNPEWVTAVDFNRLTSA